MSADYMTHISPETAAALERASDDGRAATEARWALTASRKRVILIGETVRVPGLTRANLRAVYGDRIQD